MAQEHVRSGVGKKPLRVNEHVFAVVISACTSGNSVNSNSDNDVAASHPTTFFSAAISGGEKARASGSGFGATKQKPRERGFADSAATMAAAARAKALMELCGLVPSPKVYAMLIKV